MGVDALQSVVLYEVDERMIFISRKRMFISVLGRYVW